MYYIVCLFKLLITYVELVLICNRLGEFFRLYVEGKILEWERFGLFGVINCMLIHRTWNCNIRFIGPSQFAIFGPIKRKYLLYILC